MNMIYVPPSDYGISDPEPLSWQNIAIAYADYRSWVSMTVPENAKWCWIEIQSYGGPTGQVRAAYVNAIASDISSDAAMPDMTNLHVRYPKANRASNSTNDVAESGLWVPCLNKKFIWFYWGFKSPNITSGDLLVSYMFHE